MFPDVAKTTIIGGFLGDFQVNGVFQPWHYDNLHIVLHFCTSSSALC